MTQDGNFVAKKFSQNYKPRLTNWWVFPECCNRWNANKKEGGGCNIFGAACWILIESINRPIKWFRYRSRLDSPGFTRMSSAIDAGCLSSFVTSIIIPPVSFPFRLRFRFAVSFSRFSLPRDGGLSRDKREQYQNRSTSGLYIYISGKRIQCSWPWYRGRP